MLEDSLGMSKAGNSKQGTPKSQTAVRCHVRQCKNSPHQAGMRWATLHVEEKSPSSQGSHGNPLGIFRDAASLSK